MQHHVYAQSDQYPVALLIKNAAFNVGEIDLVYAGELQKVGIDREDLIAVSLPYLGKKAPVKFIKEQLEIILPALDSVGTKTIYCADANYFKVLTKSRKAEPNLGYLLKCGIDGYEHMEVVLGINHKALIHNPDNEPKLMLSLKTLASVIKGTYQGLGLDVINSVVYPPTVDDIAKELEKLHAYDRLVLDTETFSLDHDKAGVGTISFAWDEHNGIAFACDYQALQVPIDGNHGVCVPNRDRRELIREFLESYKGTLIYHGATFDIKILIAALFMKNWLDTNGLLIGLELLTEKFECTKQICYLATNTTAGNELGLKDRAHAFAGNWAKDDIKDIRKIPLPELLEYNVIDAMATNWVYDQYHPRMVADNQEELYEGLWKDSLKTIIQIELTGMAMDKGQIQVAKKKLAKIVEEQSKVFANSPAVARVTTRLQQEAMEAANAKLKTKQHPLSHFSKLKFNPNSGPQLIKLLFEDMGLPVLNRTKTKLPSTDGDTLEMLLNHTDDPDQLAVLEALSVLSAADKILTSFIPAFERAIDKGDGVVWIHGNFNMGGTVSGRLSSSDPNLQNLPAGSTYGKLVKECFIAPAGWLFCGADFNSLEDYISALTTKDPNKLKVYLDGYDGHCLRAFSYFPDKLPGIVDTVSSINSIKVQFPDVRQESKAPTFLLTYGGTYHGLMKNLGWDKDTAQLIETGYHELYKVSDAWVADKVAEAGRTGYVEVAFGLRVRTPLLKQTIAGHRTTPYEAASEARTAGNALGQSYGLLNNRAANEFMQKVWKSEYRFDIKPVALIHDAIYLIIRDDLAVVEWVNRELIKSMQWQELPEIQHDTVKLGAELSIFWPHWASELVLPNDATKQEIRALADEYEQSLKEAA